MRPLVTSAEVARAFEAARDALRTDRTRTRAALVALAIAMAIVVCLTALVERGRAATIRALERAGLSNLYLIDRGLSTAAAGGPAAADRLTAADALRHMVLDTLKKLGWESPSEEEVNSSQADNRRVDMPLGDTGRFGPSGDLAKGAM